MKHLDIELDSPELQKRNDFHIETVNNYLKRAKSTVKDPGVVGPIVWDLRRYKAVEGIRIHYPNNIKKVKCSIVLSNKF